MIVPTLTRFGRLAGERGTTSRTDAVATTSLLRQPVGVRQPPPQVSSIYFVKVVVYSSDADTRAQIRLAIGRRPEPDAPDAEVIEVATEPALYRLLAGHGTDVMVLGGASAGRPRTKSSTARRFCWSAGGPTTAGSPPGPGRTR